MPKSKVDKKYYLFRDKGYIFFNSFYGDSEIYWMSFLSGGHIDWEYYIQIKESEFFELWNQNTEIKEIRENYKKTYITTTESQGLDRKYELEKTIKLHDLSKAKETFYKSVIEKKSE